MRKVFRFLVFILLMACMSSCEERTYRITYKVYYPDNPKVYTDTSTGVIKPALESYRGTNKLVGAGGIIITTTAPIEIISIEELEEE